MKAITVKRFPATATKPIRWVASDMDGNRVGPLSEPLELRGVTAPLWAARQLCALEGWNANDLIGGQLDTNTYAFVFSPPSGSIRFD